MNEVCLPRNPLPIAVTKASEREEDSELDVLCPPSRSPASPCRNRRVPMSPLRQNIVLIVHPLETRTLTGSAPPYSLFP
jgi:hypothetical protein